MNNNYKEFIGKKINRLTIIGSVKRDKSGSIIGKRKRRYLFECKCECGNIAIIWPSKLLKGKTMSCGCYTKERQFEGRFKLDYGEASCRQIIRSYKSNARKKGYSFNLTNEECIILFKQNCHYCGIEPSRISGKSKNAYGEYLHNGIDRKDNDIGYENDNVVSCCTECNFKKGAQSYNEFIKWISRLVKNVNGKAL